MPVINVSSDSIVETQYYRDNLHGNKLYLHIDQSTNMTTNEGDASIMLNNEQVKDLISFLNDYIIFTEGKPHVVLAEPLMYPEVKIMVGKKEVKKNPEDLNPYLIQEDITTPGEEHIDYDDYFGSILPKQS